MRWGSDSHGRIQPTQVSDDPARHDRIRTGDVCRPPSPASTTTASGSAPPPAGGLRRLWRHGHAPRRRPALPVPQLRLDRCRMTIDEILHSYAISQRCLHTLWTAAHDAPGYNKKMWQELSNHLDRITRSAATAAGLPPGNPLVLANEEHVP